MQTSNTTHIQRCSVPGCPNDALVTIAYGKNVNNIKGVCAGHSIADLDAREAQRREEDALLKELGLA